MDAPTNSAPSPPTPPSSLPQLSAHHWPSTVRESASTTHLLPPGFIDTGGMTSFASCQPLKDTQPPRFRAGRSSADAAKGSRKDMNTAKIEKADRLATGLAAILKARDDSAHKLAKELDVPVKTVLSKVLYQSTYVKQRAPNIFNALVYVKGIEMNGDLSLGERYTMKEIQDAVREDLRNDTVTEEEKEYTLTALAESRLLKATGSRSSNTAADADGRATVAHLTDEIINLGSRTGAATLALVVKGHIHDDFASTVIECNGSSAFFLDVFNINAVDVLSKFEQWACAKDQVSKRLNNLNTIRSDCTALVTKKLRVATNRVKIKMSYTNYVKSIVLVHRVHLIGWPDAVPFACPSNLTTIGLAKRLRNALTVGTCTWTPVSKGQLAEYEAEQEAEEQQVGNTTKTRKGRSDKGKRHTRKENQDSRQHIQEEGSESDDEEYGGGNKDGDEDEDTRDEDDKDEDDITDNENPLPPKRAKPLAPRAVAAPKPGTPPAAAPVPSIPLPVALLPPTVSSPPAPVTTTPFLAAPDEAAHSTPLAVSSPPASITATPFIAVPNNTVHSNAPAVPLLKKKRKERSDKGKKRPRKDGNGDKENPQLQMKKAKINAASNMLPAPRRRPGSDQEKRKKIAAQLPPGFRSREFIVNEDDDGDNGVAQSTTATLSSSSSVSNQACAAT